MKTHLFLSVLGERPHGDGVFGHQKRIFSKTLSRVDLFENAVFMFSCGRVKTELFENADVKASIYDVSEHAHGSLGTTKGHFDCLFSFVEVRTAKFECSSVFVWTGIFSKTLLVWTRIFLKTDEKKMRFQKYPDTCGRGLSLVSFSLNRNSSLIIVLEHRQFANRDELNENHALTLIVNGSVC